MNTLKRFLAGTLCLFSSYFIALFLVDLLRGGDGKTEMGVLVGLVVFFSGSFFAGVRLYRSAASDVTRPAPVNAQREVAVLQLASQNGGTLGASDVGARLRLPFAEARLTLENLRKQGACELVVTETGVELYRFPDLSLRPGEAAQAKDLLQG